MKKNKNNKNKNKNKNTIIILIIIITIANNNTKNREQTSSAVDLLPVGTRANNLETSKLGLHNSLIHISLLLSEFSIRRE